MLTAPFVGAKKPIIIEAYRNPLNRLPFVSSILNLSSEVVRKVAPNKGDGFQNTLQMADIKGERTHQPIDWPTEMKKP